MKSPCKHLTEAELTKQPNTVGCEECLRIGASWVHLRICLACGHVGCCDSSKNQHATKHYKQTKHPVVRSGEFGERWAWCYADEAYIDDI